MNTMQRLVKSFLPNLGFSFYAIHKCGERFALSDRSSRERTTERFPDLCLDLGA